MSNPNRGGRRGFRNNKLKNANNKHEISETNDDNTNPIILAAFRSYSKELDDKHDRYERIIKVSRDVTVESKRIIFLLHTIDSRKKNQNIVLEEAKKRLQTLFDNHFFSIAKELRSLDVYQYARAYSAGLQEFIEAYTFYEFLNEKKLSSWKDLQKHLSYEIEKNTTSKDVSEVGDQPIEIVKIEEGKVDINTETISHVEKTIVTCFIQPTEFILGLGDLTGEIMRRCINSLGSGDIETCFQSCHALKSFYSNFLGLNLIRHKEVNRKIYTLRQSVLKTENVCYNVKVRGGEAAVWGSVNDAFTVEKNDENDEGFF